MTNINKFDSAKCTPEALEYITKIREAYKVLADLIQYPNNDRLGDTNVKLISSGERELEIAMTNLEQSAMWAIKSISHYNIAE